MEPNISDADIAKDVLHNDDHSRLTQEEIAKAVAHHNKHHKEDAQQSGQEKRQPGKKQDAGRPK
ncbi:MAG TPA: hypothetical protein VGI45_07665 [Terracidiphilus sp.]|jgi:hypothetical protein